MTGVRSGNEVKILECKVLGSLEVCVAGRVQSVGSRKQQVILASLLMYANRSVAVDELVDELWPTGPPASAVANVNTYVGNLRRLLKRSGDKTERIKRNGRSFQLRVGADELDLFAFEEEMRRGREGFARGDLELSVTLLATAWDRWRGPLIAGLPRGPLLAARCATVEEERLNLAEDLAEVWLRRREPTRAAALLREHLSANPLRERGHATLVQALYQLGDIAGALSAYTAARQAMVEHLGIEPGDELQRLHSAVLRRDPALDAGASNLISVGPIRAVAPPRELPAEACNFAGRIAEAAQACGILVSRGEHGRHRAATLVLYGRGGVGKSALAVKVAHKVAKDFPDGQFYVDLYRGLSPLPPLDALCRLLRSLGVAENELPDSEIDAAAQFRTLTANGRMLLVLDNASDPAQIIPLLPANGGCAVIVTSRQSFAAVDADGHLNVGGLPASDGIALLRAIAHDVEIDPEVAARIVEACDGLPLAVRIAAGRLIHRPDLTPEELAERLANERQRLDELELGSLSIRACIRIGYDTVVSHPGRVEQLAARAFRLLGLLNVPNVQLGVVAAMLAEPDLQLVRRALDHLVDVQLLAPRCGGRYQLHDLVRLFAAEQMATEPAHTRAAVLRRALPYGVPPLDRTP